MTRLYLSIPLIWLLSHSTLLAQQPTASNPSEPHRQTGRTGPSAHERIRFEHLTTADGLPENSATALIQDR